MAAMAATCLPGLDVDSSPALMHNMLTTLQELSRSLSQPLLTICQTEAISV